MLNGRPEIEPPADYSSRSPEEEFVVPLLKIAIGAPTDRLVSQRHMASRSFAQKHGFAIEAETPLSTQLGYFRNPVAFEASSGLFSEPRSILCGEFLRFAKEQTPQVPAAFF